MSAGHTLDVLAEEKFRIGRLSREDALVLKAEIIRVFDLPTGL